MKTVLYLLIFIAFYSCKAQVVPYNSDQIKLIPNSNVYHKDTENNFNPFEGIWKWENALTGSELIIELKKYENLDDGDGFTYDVLAGEYKYVSNNVELANTLASLSNTNINGFLHKIAGTNLMSKFTKPECQDCPEDDIRVRLSIENDTYEGVYAELILQHFVAQGIEKLKVLVKDGPWLSQDPNAPADIDIPFGEYIMAKQ